jgi:regulator of replication initiation timing
MAQSGAARQAAFRARQQELRRERIAVLEREIAKLRREIDDFSVKVAALQNENGLLRDDKATLTEALRASREAAKRRAKVVEVAGRQRQASAQKAAPRRSQRISPSSCGSRHRANERNKVADLYEHDILLWSESQAALLRRLASGERVNGEIDRCWAKRCAKATGWRCLSCARACSS